MAKTPSSKKLSSHGVPAYVVSPESDLCSIWYFKGFGVARIYVKGVSQCVQCAILGKLRICEECELYAKLTRFQVKFKLWLLCQIMRTPLYAYNLNCSCMCPLS